MSIFFFVFFFQAEDGIRDGHVTGVQTCALPIYVMHSIDNSLRRLGTDYVDLYQIHRFDASTPIEETLRALDDAVKAGKALYIGASAMYAWQLMKMLAASDRFGLARFIAMQNYYNVIYREEEREMLPLCRAEGIAVTPF